MACDLLCFAAGKPAAAPGELGGEKKKGKPSALAARERQRKPCKVETQGRDMDMGLD